MLRRANLLLVLILSIFFVSMIDVYAVPEIIVDKSMQRLAYWDNETFKVYLFCPVSTGIDPSDTPEGIFKTSDYYPEWHELFYNQWAYGAIRINGSILLHSTPYASPNISSLDELELAKLGTPASHGCIRMSTENILYLVQNVPKGTRVIVMP